MALILFLDYTFGIPPTLFIPSKMRSAITIAPFLVLSACAAPLPPMTSAPAPVPEASTDADTYRNTGLTTIPVYMGVKAGTLAGTILLPEGKGPFPVVLIIAGSGPTDRDGNSGILGSNNSLKMLAEGLAKRGIASLRYDKRGIGASKDAVVSESELTFDDFVDDAVEWVKLLRDDDQFSTITIVGHSEGSLIGMLAAERAKADAFVSLAGSGRSMSDVLREQLQGLTNSERLRLAFLTAWTQEKR